jgi:hypothetical protein
MLLRISVFQKKMMKQKFRSMEPQNKWRQKFLLREYLKIENFKITIKFLLKLFRKNNENMTM